MRSKYFAIIFSILLASLSFWLFYKHLFDNGFGVFNLITSGSPSEIVSTRSGELLAGDKVLGRFNSPYPNLGIVSVRFHNQHRDSDDVLAFRLKEVGKDIWYYQAEYKTDQFLPGKLFPFGFPIIEKSDGRTYIFEIESLRGATGSGILIDKTNPLFTSASFFNKSEIINDEVKLTSFITKKIINVVGDRTNLTSAIIYFSPLIFYLIYLFAQGVTFQFLSGITILSVLVDIFYISYISEYFLISVSFLWVITVIRHKFESKISALISLICLLLSSLMFLLNKNIFNEKTAVWAYLFLCIAMAQKLYEYKYGQKRNFKLSEFIKTFNQFSLENTSKQNMLIGGFLVFTTYIVSIKLFLSAITIIKKGIQIFLGFYPSSYPSGVLTYLVAITLVLLILLWFSVKNYRLFKSNKILVFIIALLFQQSSSLITSKFTSFQYAPKIFTVSPQVTSEAWVDVTVTGKNFQDQPFVGKVFINGVEQGEYLLHWSSEKVTFRTNPIITKSGNVCIETLSKGWSNCVPFKYNFNVK